MAIGVGGGSYYDSDEAREIHEELRPRIRKLEDQNTRQAVKIRLLEEYNNALLELAGKVNLALYANTANKIHLKRQALIEFNRENEGKP